MPALTFFVYIAVNWWASWYPGAEPGGGGYVAQRILSTRDERHALLAALWFNLAHYALRPWPWILVALVSMLLYPGLANPEEGYVRVMVDHLPPVWRGFLLAAFFAAYMSTVSTHLNWGASYVVNDVYRRFWRPGAEPGHYANAGRLATVLIMVVAGIITYYLKSVEGAWKFLLAIGAGTGLVYLGRWYWWRINAWSEVAAMTGAFALSLGLQFGAGLNVDDPRDFARLMLGMVAGTTIVWLGVTYLTPAEPLDHLRRFCAKVRPGGPGWRRVTGGECSGDGPALRGLLHWALGCVVVYLGVFGIGSLVLGQPARGTAFLLAAVALTVWILSDSKKIVIR